MKLSTLTFAALSAAFVLMPHVSSVKAQNDAITGGKKAASDKLNIASNIQGQERDVIAASMSTLAPEDRENVIMIDEDGNAHANKSWLLNQGSIGVSEENNVYEDQMGHSFSMPQQVEKPISLVQTISDLPTSVRSDLLKPKVYTPVTYPGSGYYRRVWSTVPASDSVIGHSYAEATVYLPSRYVPAKHPGIFERISASTVAEAGTHDTGCVYLGGWSAGYTDANNKKFAGAPADAGFSHDNGSNTANSSRTVQPARDSWVMTIYYNRLNNQRPAKVTFAFRLLADQTVPFKFYISHDAASGDTFLNLAATAHAQSYTANSTTHQYDDLGTHTWTISVKANLPNDAWHIDGRGVVLKRMTTIAQDNGQKPTTCSYIRNVQWTHCRIGVSDQAPNAYVEDWDYTHTGGTENYPASPSNRVRVKDLNPDPSAPGHLDYRQETDNISMCGR